MRRIPDRLTADRIGHWQSTHIPLQRPPQPHKGSAGRTQALRDSARQEPGPPSPSGYILPGRRINRSVPRGPATTVTDGLRVRPTGRSQRRSPDGLYTRNTFTRPHRQHVPARVRGPQRPAGQTRRFKAPPDTADTPTLANQHASQQEGWSLLLSFTLHVVGKATF